MGDVLQVKYLRKLRKPTNVVMDEEKEEESVASINKGRQIQSLLQKLQQPSRKAADEEEELRKALGLDYEEDV